MEGLVSAAGGTSDQVDPERLSLIVRATDPDRAQRVDLNRADAWLLETLPGIGPRTASAIIDYRNKNGPFRMVNDLLNVPGIGDATMVRLSEYVTVGE
ncbi:MAG: helix-hairpin-helix domain-containing protein [Chloroflexi bacterium]|nr:helix-hairpin-helix domain-containing protein [Chloroflexota bacterium]